MRRGLWLWAVIGCALLLHGPFLAQRAALERQNDTVELVVDYESARFAAERSGASVEELLREWRALGITSVALGGAAEVRGSDSAPDATGDVASDSTLDAMGDVAANSIPDPTGDVASDSTPGPTGDVDDRPTVTDGTVHVDGEDTRWTADWQRLTTAAAAMERIVPRTLEIAREAAARGMVVGPYIPRGETVEGFPDDLSVTAATLIRLGLPLGIVEFAGAAGRDRLLQLLDHTAVFVHSIPVREIQRMSPERAVARFHRAVFERQARLLYIHLPFGPEDEEFLDGGIAPGDITDVRVAGGDGADGRDLAGRASVDPALRERFRSYLSDIVDMVRNAGLRVGPATSAPRWRTPGSVPVAAAAGAGAALALLFRQTPVPAWFSSRQRRGRRRWPGPWVVDMASVGIPTVAVWSLLALGRDVVARQGAALAVAFAFPVLAIVLAARLVGANGFRESRRTVPPWLRCLGGLFVVAGIGAAGALLVAGALGETRFLLKLEQFRGVKLAHAIPFVVLTLWWLTTGSYDGRGASGLDISASSEPRAVGKLPDAMGPRPSRTPNRAFRFLWTYGLLALVALALGFVVVARTGHDLLPVSEAERAMREWLEVTLPVRPRTKEFLLGYPALVVGLWLAAYRPRFAATWTAPFLIAGALVPVSIINTFGHAHIGLGVSAVRSILGLWLGTLLGLAVVGLYVLLALRSRRARKVEKAW